ncbi:MotE family protein [Alicyclobacillus vulcanalis]|uniref:Flagellar motility protein MotE, a chaperone for MotC folding n=2 Tax=Alicyclobacillus TaxID=29330 RepID=A0A1N7MWZ0_9BACL|nr:hypothetical protein [Alicyclobacillus vulcanalis]SIS90592.1 Flagellar motility protein MotE, a chaperone for MotC folding [Alicyclobacillus vulcanalis]
MEARRSSVTSRANTNASATPKAGSDGRGRANPPRPPAEDPSRAQTSLDDDKPSMARRVGTLLLLVLVPLVVAGAALAAVLVVLGVPLGQDLEHLFGGKKAAPANAQDQALRQTVAIERAQIQSLQSQVASLNQQLSSAREQSAALRDEVNGLRAKLASLANGQKEGAAEAKILAQMDPSAAAQVLQHMPSSQAAWAVATLTPDASGPILQALPPATASALLQQAARDSQAAAVSNSTANATP